MTDDTTPQAEPDSCPTREQSAAALDNALDDVARLVEHGIRTPNVTPASVKVAHETVDLLHAAHDQSRAEVERLRAELATAERLLADVDAFLSAHFRNGPQTPCMIRAALARHQARQGGDDG
jgi:hypothetical protein